MINEVKFIYRLFIKPWIKIEDRVQFFTFELHTSLLLFYSLSLFLLSLYASFQSEFSASLTKAQLYLIYLSFVVDFTSYLLSRTRYYQIGSMLCSVFSTLAVLGVVYTDPRVTTISGAMIWLILPCLFSSLVVSYYWIIFHLTGTLFLLAIIYQNIPSSSQQTLVTSSIAYFCCAGFIIISGYIRKKSEELNTNQQEQIIQLSKLTTLGETASGIAHEINNPLTVIIGRSEATIRHLQKSQEIHSQTTQKSIENFEKILNHSVRINKIIKGLSTLSRGSANDPLEPYPIHSLIEDTLEVAQDKIHRNNVIIKFEKTPEDWLILVRPSQFGQVLLNLLNNSIDAIKDKEEKWIQLEVHFLPLNYFEFKLTDSGSGIPHAVAKKIGSSFFTTKGPRHGTGIGLNICKRIIESHEGSFKYNPESKNTQFIFTLKKA